MSLNSYLMFFRNPTQKTISTNRCWLFFVIFCAFPAAIFAQSAHTIQGTVVDSATLNALPFVTCTLSGTAVKHPDFHAALSNNQGKFEFKNMPNGIYQLSFKFFSNYEKKLLITLSDKDSTILDLGTVKLSANRNLREVKITSQNIISQGTDRINYNVENDPQSATTNILNIIDKVPLLSVDFQGTVKYQGSTALKILIDDKPYPFSNSISEVLKAIPAENVKRIEVITSPSGRYLSEGAIAVVNIVTKKKITDGLEGSANFEYRAPANGPSAGISVSAKKGKLGINILSALAERDKPATSVEISRSVSGQQEDFDQQGNNQANYKSKFIDIGAAYEVDSLNLISMKFGLYGLNNSAGSMFNTVIQGVVPSSYTIENKNSSIFDGQLAEIDYQKNFSGNKNKILNLSYLFNNGKTSENDGVMFSQQINSSNQDYAQNNAYLQHEHSLQLDFTNKMKNLKVDAGIKGVARLGSSDFAEIIPGTAVTPANGIEYYHDDLYIVSGYNTYQEAFKMFTISAGYQLDYTNSDIFGNTIVQNHQSAYLTVLPNSSINWKMNDKNTLQLIYITTIRRPNISYLDPYVNKLNPNLEIAGNPDLSPVRINNYNLQYRKIGKAAFIASLSYNYSTGLIQQVLTNTNATDVSRLTYMNIGTKNDFNLNLSYYKTLFRRLSMNASGNLTHSELSGVINNVAVANSGFTGDVNLGLGLSVNKNLYVNGKFSYSAPIITLQSTSTSYPYFVFTGTQSLFKKKASVGLSFINPFSKYRNITTTYHGNGFDQATSNQNYYRIISLTAVYRFGLLKKQIRNNRKDIKNNDLMELKN